MKTKQKIIGSIVVLVILIIFLVVGFVINKPKSYKYNEDDIFVEDTLSEDDNKNENNMITVCIKGQVKSPGVYKLTSGSIVNDLIKAAGGLTSEADPDNKLNLAKKLKDEDYVYVDKKPDLVSNANNNKTSSNTSTQNDKIDINSASIEELDKIPGVGPVTAQKIIDYREKNGYFTSIEDLTKIDGIGEKTVDKFRDVIDIR